VCLEPLAVFFFSFNILFISFTNGYLISNYPYNPNDGVQQPMQRLIIDGVRNPHSSNDMHMILNYLHIRIRNLNRYRD
jgi:hypothetical protein